MTAEQIEEMCRHFDPHNPAVMDRHVNCWGAYFELALSAPQPTTKEVKRMIPKHGPDPNFDGEQTFFIIDDPVLEADTQSYAGNEYELDMMAARIEARHAVRVQDGAYVSMVTGDQQTFNLCVRMKMRGSETHRWVVPQAGGLHVVMHFLEAHWRLWHARYIRRFVIWLDLEAGPMKKGLHDKFTPKDFNQNPACQQHQTHGMHCKCQS